jgi:cytochrome c peroxidase
MMPNTVHKTKFNRLLLFSIIIMTLFMISHTSFAIENSMPSFSDKEKAIIQSLASKPQAIQCDPTNRVSGNKKAIEFGQHLFFDKRLSGDGQLSCASCHDPKQGFAKHEKISDPRDSKHVKRHVPHLWGMAYNRWYFWDGRADSLWSQALFPLEDGAEMANNRVNLVKVILENKDLKKSYEEIFGEIPQSLKKADLTVAAKPHPKQPNYPEHQAWLALSEEEKGHINQVFSNLGKALASFEETLLAQYTAFDQFAQQLKNNTLHDEAEIAAISPLAAQGLKLFIGKAACINCHFGENFSDGEFHHSFLEKIDFKHDLGRYTAIKPLLNNEFNANSTFNDVDEHDKTYRNKLDYIYQNIEFRGQFKTPSLRNIALTYPYMHTGEFNDLAEVIDYYNNISDRMDETDHREILLTSLFLSEYEKKALLAFLNTLTDESVIDNIIGGK